MFANSESSGETARMLAGVFAGRLCDKYYNPMRWLINAKKGGTAHVGLRFIFKKDLELRLL